MTKEDNNMTATTTIDQQMAQAHTLATVDPTTDVDAFIAKVTAEKQKGELVQTDGDIGGSPL